MRALRRSGLRRDTGVQLQVTWQLCQTNGTTVSPCSNKLTNYIIGNRIIYIIKCYIEGDCGDSGTGTTRQCPGLKFDIMV